MFIETLEDVLVQISQINLIGPPRKDKHGAWVCDVQMINHGDLPHPTILASDKEKLATAIIPALPGYELLVAPPSWEPKFWLSRSPIIAWRISYLNGNPSPVTAGNDEQSDSPQAILMPNGKVEVQFDRTFDSLASWEKYAKLEHDKARAENKLTA